MKDADVFDSDLSDLSDLSEGEGYKEKQTTHEPEPEPVPVPVDNQVDPLPKEGVPAQQSEAEFPPPVIGEDLPTGTLGAKCIFLLALKWRLIVMPSKIVWAKIRVYLHTFVTLT